MASQVVTEFEDGTKQLWVTGYALTWTGGSFAPPINSHYKSRLMVRRGICRTKHKVILKCARLPLRNPTPTSSVPVVAAISLRHPPWQPTGWFCGYIHQGLAQWFFGATVVRCTRTTWGLGQNPAHRRHPFVQPLQSQPIGTRTQGKERRTEHAASDGRRNKPLVLKESLGQTWW